MGIRFAVALTCVALLAVGCGSSSKPGGGAPNPNAAEKSPPGDIPDNQAFVAYSLPGASSSVKVPEGWARSKAGAAVVFSDKLNSVRIETAPRRATVSSLKQRYGSDVSKVRRQAGAAIRTRYLVTGKPDPVTGKRRQLAVERYDYSHRGKNLTLILSGARGADNVDPWRIVSDSVRWR